LKLLIFEVAGRSPTSRPPPWNPLGGGRWGSDRPPSHETPIDINFTFSNIKNGPLVNLMVQIEALSQVLSVETASERLGPFMNFWISYPQINAPNWMKFSFFPKLLWELWMKGVYMGESWIWAFRCNLQIHQRYAHEKKKTNGLIFFSNSFFFCPTTIPVNLAKTKKWSGELHPMVILGVVPPTWGVPWVQKKL